MYLHNPLISKKSRERISRLMTSLPAKVIISLVVCLVIYRYISLQDIVYALVHADYIYIGLRLPLLFVHYGLLGLSTWILLLPIKPLNMQTVIKYQTYTSAIAYFTPAQIGEGFIAILLQKENVDFQKAFALFFFNKCINISITLFLAIPTLSILDMRSA